MCEIIFEKVTLKMEESSSEIECRRLQSEIKVVQAKLAPYQMRKRREELLEKNKDDLEVQLRQSKMEMEQLQLQLKMIVRQGDDARKAKAAAEAKLSRFKIIRQGQLKKLVMELNSGAFSSSSRFQSDAIKTEGEIKSEKENTMNGEGSLKDDLTSLPVSSQNMELQEAPPTPPIQSLTTVESTQEKRKSLEAEEQPAKKLKNAPASTDNHKISAGRSQDKQSNNNNTSSAASDGEVSRPQQAEAVPSQERERERSISIHSDESTSENGDQSSVVSSDSSDIHESSSNSSDIGESSSEPSDGDASLTDNPPELSAVNPSCSNHESDNITDTPPEASAVNPSCSTDKSDSENPTKSSGKKKRKYKRLKVGMHYVLVSRRFFNIDFKKEYRLTKSKRLACKKCPLVFHNHQQMIDHLWFVHHGGRYKCPHRCYVGFFRCRNSIRNHIRIRHPDLCKNPEVEAEDKS